MLLRITEIDVDGEDGRRELVKPWSIPKTFMPMILKASMRRAEPQQISSAKKLLSKLGDNEEDPDAIVDSCMSPSAAG